MPQNNALTYSGKTTLISGAAGGIGFALAKEFGELGMNVVIADIDEAALASAKMQLESLNINVLACKLDVTDFSQWQACVEQTIATFGMLHMLVNNAGVGGVPGKIEQADHDIWRWVIDVNLMGVVYGAQAAIPEIKRHGEGGWIVNVASMAGMMGVPYASSYSATKAAVVSMTESWAVELKSHNIQVSALCPAFVKTRIHESMRNKQDKYKSSTKSKEIAPADKDRYKKNFGQAAALVESGIAPELLAKRVVEALNSGQMYIFTHPNYKEVAGYRAVMIDKAFDDAQQSELVKHLIDDDIVSL
ncbi:SDR family NAD(P)-dependent oxidoreductase [Brumicola pallidula]|jgi:NAD(P)-dependent dehydrogenase (short-subunit alcohol dehydrogenase family)|uniref:Diacetyl reductase [(S)-acetoin forming] n=1 Tax=Brumicola pallidula DSM 14239 = ACAM 615 TaxID=1121922 RepID=K6YDV0_9ALTE|nr:SDR family NAD(P)-dependent oxidoreductase [Glaciecola pallidula]GAC30919.1 diacetyl reductase [(S)-acetoin forming] [Glaciecola pallidula DSM 14239 = ACAM 615]